MPYSNKHKCFWHFDTILKKIWNFYYHDSWSLWQSYFFGFERCVLESHNRIFPEIDRYREYNHGMALNTVNTFFTRRVTKKKKKNVCLNFFYIKYYHKKNLKNLGLVEEGYFRTPYDLLLEIQSWRGWWFWELYEGEGGEVEGLESSTRGGGGRGDGGGGGEVRFLLKNHHWNQNSINVFLAYLGKFKSYTQKYMLSS